MVTPQANQPAPASVAPLPALPGNTSGLPAVILNQSVPPGVVPPAALPPGPTQTKSSGGSQNQSQFPKSLSSPAKPTSNKQAQATPEATSTTKAVANLGNLYYVVANYSGDNSLQQVRKVFEDAYVENFPKGAKIQIGAFKRESEAKTLIEQLQQKGISASIYHP